MGPALHAQETEPVSAEAIGFGLSPEEKLCLGRGLSKLFCLALVQEDWFLFYKFALLTAVAEDNKIRKKNQAGSLMRTLPDSSTDPSQSDPERTDVWDESISNGIQVNALDFAKHENGTVTLGSRNSAASDAISAGALAHEATHFDDEYRFKDQEPDCAGCAGALDEEEVKGADCELRVLRALRQGVCMDPVTLPAALPDINARIKEIEEFKAKHQ